MKWRQRKGVGLEKTGGGGGGGEEEGGGVPLFPKF